MEIKPVNANATFSFSLSEISEIKIEDYLPDELKNELKSLGWDKAINEINRHWQIISKARIWSPYPIQAYCVAEAEAPSLSNSLSGSSISFFLQDNINEWSKVSVQYYLFPLLNSKYQSQAIAKLICETLPDSKTGEITAWIDALQENELSPENLRDVVMALKQINI